MCAVLILLVFLSSFATYMCIRRYKYFHVDQQKVFLAPGGKSLPDQPPFHFDRIQSRVRSIKSICKALNVLDYEEKEEIAQRCLKKTQHEQVSYCSLFSGIVTV